MKKKYIRKGLKIVFQRLRQYKDDLILLSILGVISAIANGSVPYLVGRLFDSILEPSMIFQEMSFEMPLFLFFILIWLGVQSIANFVGWRSRRRSDTIREISYADYLVEGASHLLELPIAFHKDQKLGKVMDKIQRAANYFSIIVSDVIIDLAPQFLSIIVALIISFYIHPLLASILVIGVFIYVLTLIRLVAPVAQLQRRTFRTQARASGYVYGALSNIMTVKQATAEKYEQKKFFELFRINIVRLWKRLFSIWQGLSFSRRVIVMLTQLTIFGLSAWFIQKGTLTIGQLVMFNGYAMMFFGPFVRLGRDWRFIQNGLVAVQEVDKILSIPKERYIPQNVVILSDIKGEVVFENVDFAYHKKQGRVLDDVSFKAMPGEVVALVGESGVGKSTLIDLISGYYFLQKGKILIDGHDIRNLDLKFIRSKIAVVPQEVVLFNDTIKNNIAYGNFSATDKEIKKAAEQSYASEFIESFPKKYKQIVGERGIKLSVGQKQRVAIARAILRDPRILILDEPTSALDAQSEKFISQSLQKLMKNRTTFIIAHRLSTIRHADKILVLKEGNIVEQGKHDDLIRIPNGVYRHFYRLQFGVI
ncbi:ABC transporter ATP-binding protein/permease [Patescibacteria group bacterium AH-259-L07]|nr:ABC transporter ATP-binding protein/permease [Patescibacteria group bacterium AH-259-L07]